MTRWVWHNMFETIQTIAQSSVNLKDKMNKAYEFAAEHLAIYDEPDY